MDVLRPYDRVSSAELQEDGEAGGSEGATNPLHETEEAADEPEATFEVRVLDVKNNGSSTCVRVLTSGSVDDLQRRVEAECSVSVARQRLIIRGREMKSGEPLSAHKLPAATLQTVHLFVRPEAAPPQPEQSATAPADLNPMALEALSAAFFGGSLAAAGVPNRPTAEGEAPAPRAHRYESVSRSAARVRLLSSLLALYCGLNALSATIDATTTSRSNTGTSSEQNAQPSSGAYDPNAGLSRSAAETHSFVELALNIAGVWVGGAGLRASQRLDLRTADRFDRSLRCLAVATLSYETYHSLVALPNSNLVRDEDLDLGDWGYDDATVRTDADDDPPDEADAGDGAAAVSGNGTVGDGASDAGADEESADSAGTAAVGFTRESLMLSGLVTLALWSAIWLACIQNSARLRAALRHDEPPAGGIELQQLPHGFYFP